MIKAKTSAGVKPRDGVTNTKFANFIVLNRKVVSNHCSPVRCHWNTNFKSQLECRVNSKLRWGHLQGHISTVVPVMSESPQDFHHFQPTLTYSGPANTRVPRASLQIVFTVVHQQSWAQMVMLWINSDLRDTGVRLRSASVRTSKQPAAVLPHIPSCVLRKVSVCLFVYFSQIINSCCCVDKIIIFSVFSI